MSHIDNVIDILRPVEFTIDGRRYATTVRRQRASDLLRMAGLDPVGYDLAELRGRRPFPVRYDRADVVEIHKGTRFVTLRDRIELL
jgi:hypothetical protein